MNRPFRAGVGAQNIGTGFAAGAQDMFSNAISGVKTGLDMKYADIAQQRQDMFNRGQAMNEGAMLAERSPAVLVGNAGGPGMPAAGAPDGGGMGDDGPVGAQALATQQSQGPPNPYDPENLSVDDLRNLAFDRGQQAKQQALGNQNDMESLQKAYHYNALMKQTKPYMDKWAQGLMEVKKNPNDMKSYRMLQVLTGQDDPTAALSMATNEYAKLREQYEGYSKNYGPLNDYLTKRGITGDMYDDEAKFIQFMNQKQFMPHSPGAAKMPKPRMAGPRQGR